MSFFIPYTCPPNDLLARQLDLSADSILAEYKKYKDDNYSELTEWVRKLYQIEVVPQFELSMLTVKVPPLEEGVVAEPVSSNGLLVAAEALEKGNYELAERIISKIAGMEYQTVDKKLIGIVVSLPGAFNEQEEFIKIFYPHDNEIKLSQSELAIMLERFNSEDAKLIAHYSGLFLRREYINNPSKYHLAANKWLGKALKAKDPIDTIRIMSVWVVEYGLKFDRKKIKNFKRFFQSHAKYLADDVLDRKEMEEYHSETFKRRRNIIAPPTPAPTNQVEYNYWSNGKGEYYIWKHQVHWYDNIWSKIKSWFQLT
jgi:hypothetical protein